MKLITVSGPPASGKTSVLTKIIKIMLESKYKVGVVKFDCLQTGDDLIFQKLGVPALKGLSAELCPDHYFISNIEDIYEWGEKQKLDILISESAGLCNRCSPHIKDIPAVCTIDQLSGVQAPQKIGPMLKLADMILITKGDIVSQAEREVFYRKVQQMNPRAKIYHVNGLTGQGSQVVADRLMEMAQDAPIRDKGLRFPMPMALCSYCLGETKIGKEYQIGNVKKVKINTNEREIV